VRSPQGPLSYSSVSTYWECPLRWKFLYVDRLPETPRGYFSFGRTIHSVLEELVRPLVIAPATGPRIGTPQTTLEGWALEGPSPPGGRVMGAAELQALYRRTWVSEGYGSKEEEERYRAQGEELLLAYRALLEASPPAPIAVEQHLSTSWDGIPIHGYIDRIDRTPTGALEIVDYKTTRELSHDDAQGSDQLAIYQVLVERNYPEPVEALTLYHLRSLRPLTVRPRPAERLDALHVRVGEARDGIREQAFEPTPGRHCTRCDFRPICPEFREVPAAERDRLARLADRFAQLREEELRLEGELRWTAQELHSAAESLGVHRIPGRQLTLVRRHERRPIVPTAPPPEGPARAERAGEGPPSATTGPGVPAVPAGPRTARSRATWYWEIERSRVEE
jgi:putative RecB family exonuclease